MRRHTFTPLPALYSIFLGIAILCQHDIIRFNFANIDIDLHFNWQNKLIGLAFSVITFATTLYAQSQNRIFEAFMGNLYYTATLGCLLTNDFILMFIFLEFMVIFAGLLIYHGPYQTSLKAAVQYFLTHLFSAGLILIGVGLIIIRTNSSEIISLTGFARNYDLSALLILAGCLINIGTLFFSGWMVNCYPYASNAGFIYLMSFTSKISIIILIKLFAGLEILKILGILMILYGGFYALIENNLKRLLCYLSLAQLGFMSIAISFGSPKIITGVICFLFIHILYKALLCLYIGILEDKQNIKNYSEIRNISLFKKPLLIFYLGFSVLTAISFPSLWSFTIKTFIVQQFTDNTSYYAGLLLQFLNAIALLSLVIEHRFVSRSHPIKLTFLTKSSLLSLLMITIFSGWICRHFSPIKIFNIQLHDYTKQLSIIIIAGILALMLHKIPRISTFSFNLDLFQWIEKICQYFYTAYKQKPSEEDDQQSSDFSNIIKSILNKMQLLHNQQTSIMIVIIFLISFMLGLILL